MDAEGDGRDSDVEGNELEEHVDAVMEKPFNESAGDVPDGRHKSFLKLTARGSTQMIGEISTLVDLEASIDLLRKVKLP